MTWQSVSRAMLVTMMLVACGDPSVSPTAIVAPVRTSGNAPAASPPGVVTLPVTGMSLVSDNKGDYVNNVCGVLVSGPSSTGVSLWPTGSSIPQSQTASCTGVAPRGATLTMAVQHVINVPDMDSASVSSTYHLSNFKMGFGANGLVNVAVINAGSYCFYRAKNGSLSGKGLRFDPVNYPKSSYLRYKQTASSWHVYSAPYPDNLAYCEGDAGISYWHVTVDFTTNVQP